MRKLCKFLSAVTQSVTHKGGSMSDWISVEERFPKRTDGDVLALNDGIHVITMWCGPEKTDWYTPKADKCANVTHWMPLPEPPK